MLGVLNSHLHLCGVPVEGGYRKEWHERKVQRDSLNQHWARLARELLLDQLGTWKTPQRSDSLTTETQTGCYGLKIAESQGRRDKQLQRGEKETL